LATRTRRIDRIDGDIVADNTQNDGRVALRTYPP
jgi:hypothetical protein